MDYEDLISKYLDGELSPSEDEVLRSEIAQNPDLKMDFDDSIFVHYALKEDAESLKVPEDLKINTQDLVLMKIVGDRPNIIKMDNRISAFRQFAASVAAVILLGFANINDYSMFRHLSELYTYQTNQINQQIESEQAIEANANAGKARKNNSRKNNIRENKTTNNYSNNFGLSSRKIENKTQIEESNSNAEIEEVATTSILMNSNSSNKIEIQQPTIAAPIAMNVIDKLKSSEVSPVLAKKAVANTDAKSQEMSRLLAGNIQNNVSGINAQSSHISFDNSNYAKNNIRYIDANNWTNNNRFNNTLNSDPLVNLEINSYYSSNSISNTLKDPDTKLSMGFSYSIGYGIDQKHKFGVEVGSINQRYTVVEMLQVPVTVYTNDPSGSATAPGPTVLMPYERNNSLNYIWGSAFYEYNLLNYNDFVLDGRINIGANSLGLMNVSRLTASYHLLNTVKFSVGLDNRMFYINDFSISGTPRKLINSFGLVYGIQLSI